jgi:Flp pilus assembly protein TadG
MDVGELGRDRREGARQIGAERLLPNFARTRDEVVSNFRKAWESPMSVTSTLTRFLRDESGATAVEYGLLTPLISVVIMGSLSA